MIEHSNSKSGIIVPTPLVADDFRKLEAQTANLFELVSELVSYLTEEDMKDDITLFNALNTAARQGPRDMKRLFTRN
jgi:hypothetical protein